MVKRCNQCGVNHPIGSFTKNKKVKSGLESTCKDCQRFRMKLYNYGITREQYEAMLRNAGGACEICKDKPENSTWGHLVVDHHHASGAVRGLVCSSCNTALGMIRENPKILDGMASYLKRNGMFSGLI